jgi:hypothetical protein
MTLQPGAVLETAIWMTGAEPDELKDRFEADVRAKLAAIAENEGVIIGPLIMVEKRPGEERVPKVPKGLQGPDVRLLVGEAQVIGEAYQSDSAFVADLEPKDLERLRAILRRVYRAWNPDKPELSQERCDAYININGPEAALAALREQVGVKVH